MNKQEERFHELVSDYIAKNYPSYGNVRLHPPGQLGQPEYRVTFGRLVDPPGFVRCHVDVFRDVFESAVSKGELGIHVTGDIDDAINIQGGPLQCS